ncbi:hypothetical protein BD408DRAFT_425458 [Parasitella parasitica]|nr:hypothetical protein BD408DRAFT_425458 [Parasitella parasitica]
MQPPDSENRLLLSITLLLALFFTAFYIVYIPPSKDTSRTDRLAQQNKLNNPAKAKENPCDKVDILWLASDRIYWDGWTDKAMFMRKDGTLTKGNVYIDEGDEICVVVLLGPTPAQSSIKDEDHLGTKDSIALFATGNSTKITIELQAHKTQTNAYFAPVRFTQADTYRLDAIDEYRSYFWEAPILHNYKPYRFQSQNYLIVSKSEIPTRLPICRNDTDIQGIWVNATVFKKSNSRSMYTMFENNENQFVHNGKVFVPDSCQLEFKSEGQAIACLGTRTVHVWADNNLRRNLKAINFNRSSRWCDFEAISKIKNDSERRKQSACICNDNDEDTTQYSWITDPHVPLEFDNSWDIHTEFFYNNVGGSLTANNPKIFERMKQYATNSTSTKADIVIIGLGNDDVQGLKVSLNDFANAFRQMLINARHVYPTQPIIIRTPQYFCCGTLYTSSWNTGRSLTFSNIVRNLVYSFENMLLWDVHRLGTEETICHPQGTSYSSRNVVSMENQFLYSLICSAARSV